MVSERPFLHGRGGDACSLDHPAGEVCDVVSPLISEERLRAMLAGMRLPRMFQRFIDGHTDNRVASARISATLRRLGAEFHSNPYRGDLAVKEIAHRLGYAHVGTFTTAFVKHFNVPPPRGIPQDAGYTACRDPALEGNVEKRVSCDSWPAGIRSGG